MSSDENLSDMNRIYSSLSCLREIDPSEWNCKIKQKDLHMILLVTGVKAAEVQGLSR